MPRIRLNVTEWTYDTSDLLGPPGGFGEVFRGAGDIGPVAVKRLKLTASEAAHREMNIGQALAQRTLEYVVPVLDYGQDADSDGYFLVMPICERSLHDEILSKGVLSLTETRTVALDILSGLSEVGDIVHRDLKPQNVLFFDGKWRLADFGIAKFVEDSTSLQTLRGSLTPAYGAPEQWNSETPTHATDVYSLGCMFHTMLTGQPPFVGSQEQIRDAHLHQAPPALGVDSRLSAFVGQMLRKSPASRPSIGRCVEVVSSVEVTQARRPHAGLLEAAGEISREAAAKEAAAQAAATARRARQQLVEEAAADLKGIVDRLFGDIKLASDEVHSTQDSISLGRGTLTFGRVAEVPLAQTKRENIYGEPEWEVAAAASLAVTRSKIVRPTHTSEGGSIFYVGRETPYDRDYTWSATLFFGRSKKEPDYRWREIGFWSFAAGSPEAPYSLAPGDRNFELAFSNVMGSVDVAYGPWAVDGEDEDAFQHRWLSLFTKAVRGELNQPSSMPIGDHFFQ